MIEDFIQRKMESRVKRCFVPSSFLGKAMQSPKFEGSIVGSSSIYSPRHQCVYLLEGEGVGDYPVSPQSVARDILTDILANHGLKRFPYLTGWEDYPLVSHPLYWEARQGELIQLDLKSAFWAIYSKMPLVINFWDDSVEYLPYWLYPHLPQDLYKWKLIRNAIPGIWRSCQSTRIKNGQLKLTSSYFPTSCFPNWNFVQRTLHWFGLVALQCGAVHVYSDGYIFPANADWAWFQKFCEARGFIAETKAHGTGEVWGLARYRIGETRTKMTGQSQPIDNIIKTSDWDVILNRLKSDNPHYKESYGTLQKEHRKAT